MGKNIEQQSSFIKEVANVLDDRVFTRSIYSQIDDEWMLYLRQDVLLVLYVFNLFKSDHFSDIHYLERMVLRASAITTQQYPAKSSRPCH